jgi:hypothetical protein
MDMIIYMIISPAASAPEIDIRTMALPAWLSSRLRPDSPLLALMLLFIDELVGADPGHRRAQPRADYFDLGRGGLRPHPTLPRRDNGLN